MPGVLFTIGHSVHPLEDFFNLVHPLAIEVIADVRTKPFSRHVPQYNYRTFRSAVTNEGLRYVYLGLELGGYPPNPVQFPAGIARLLQGIEAYRVAVVCAEEDPAECHRHRLIGAELTRLAIPVQHIRSTGTLESWESAEARRSPQPSLFPSS